MSQNYCHHINAAGVFCRGIPLKKRDYCHWHLHQAGRRMKAARARAHCERVTIQVPVLDDLHAVQLGLMQLGEAIVHDEVDERKGRLLLAVLRLAASNIKARHIWEQEAEMQDSDLTQYVDEDAGFEEQYDLPKGFDLSVDPEVAFPAPTIPLHSNDGLSASPETDVRARFAQILRDAANLAPGKILQTTADDMELMDVYRREGEQARVRRAAELERNRNRRERREQRRRYAEMARNHNLQLAAEKLLLDQQRKAAAARAEADRKPPASQADESAVPATAVSFSAV